MSSTLLDDFAGELGAFRTSKGTLQFAMDKPLPAALLKKLVQARVQQNEAKGSGDFPPPKRTPQRVCKPGSRTKSC